MSMFTAITAAAFPTARRAVILTPVQWGNLALPLIFVMICGFLCAFQKSAHHLPSVHDREDDEDAGHPSLIRRLKNREVLAREIRTAIYLSSAVYFVAGIRFGLPAYLSLLNAKAGASYGWAVFSWIVLMILVMAVFGYSIPTRTAGRGEGRFAVRAWPLTSIFVLIARPVERLMLLLGSAVMTLLHLPDIEDKGQILTEDEILDMLDDGRAEGGSENDNLEFIENLFQFDDKVASEVMTHRIEIDALPIETDFEKTLAFVDETKHTRFPVYRGNVDNVVGILHVKDLLFVKSHEAFSLDKIMRVPWFTPESRNTIQLLREMQKNHIQMAIVIDEYGGTAGLLTIEDLVEQIVGNIEDEYDDAEQEMIRVAPDTWLVEGSYPIDRLARDTGVSFGDDEFDSTAGFVIALLDRIPDENEHPSVAYGPLTFQVLSVEDNRIVRLRVTRAAESSDAPESEHSHD